MTRTNSQLAKTGVRNPPVYFCRQCIAVRVFEEGGVCPTCVNVEADSIRMAEVRDKRSDTVLGLALTMMLIAVFYVLLTLLTGGAK